MVQLSDYDIVMGLRYLCINNNYFTAGDNEQYTKMFEVAKGAIKSGLKTEIDKVAAIIWICSETEDSISDIGDKISEWCSKELSKRNEQIDVDFD